MEKIHTAVLSEMAGCWSLPSPPPGHPAAATVDPAKTVITAGLGDLQPAPLPYPRPRRTGDWSGISAGWESDGAANSVQMRLRRENQQLVTFPDSDILRLRRLRSRPAPLGVNVDAAHAYEAARLSSVTRE